ncbi:ABC transporter permease [Streptomyces sp. NPDC088727]|uniref:ABC transporter permease n=1 Tax=Streptomyces sp. NPDC088727 TaxID=3365875 RepID=UPI0038061B6A
MGGYLLRRLAQAVLVVWAAFTASFCVLWLLPGDPVSVMALGGGAADVSPAQLDELRHSYGLDKSLGEQYLTQFTHLVRGDLGISVQTGDQVTHMITEALPATLELAAASLALALLGGAALALWGTYTRSRWLRRTLQSLPALGVSAPTFWVGLLLVQLVSFQWRLLPAVGNQGAGSLILPAVTLALPSGAIFAQVFTRSLRTALAEQFTQTALAKGSGRARVHLGHALRNASGPPLTLAGLLIGNLLAGAVVVETVFARTGLGRTTASAVSTQDIPVVQGLVVCGALAVALASLLVDLLHPLLDPRVTSEALLR